MISEGETAIRARRDLCASRIEWEAIRQAERLRELIPEWRKLWTASPHATPFQMPEWILAWWKHYKAQPQRPAAQGAAATNKDLLWSVVVRRAGRLIGIAPLYISDEGTKRRLLLVGTGNSDYLDAVIDDNFRAECGAAFFSALEGSRGMWSVCDLQQLPESSSLLHVLECQGGIAARREMQETCPELRFEAISSAARMLERAEYYRRKCEQQAGFAIEAATSATLEEFLRALRRLHMARCKSKGQAGALSSEGDFLFHSEVARGFLARRMLRLYVLRLAGNIAAALYAFRHRNRTYFYLSGFDPAHAALSLGTVLVAHAIREALQAKGDVFDFLRGREPYKYRWGARDRRTWRLLVEAESQGRP